MPTPVPVPTEARGGGSIAFRLLGATRFNDRIVHHHIVQHVRTFGASQAPSARTIARLMTIGRDRLSKAETVTVAAIESGVELLVEAREIVADFQAMIRRGALAELDPWIERAKTSLVAAFVNGVTKDKAAVSAAISSGWSNGQTEGQITKLKLVKHQMYGRGKLDLLQARVMGAT
jgi:transposase